MKELSKDIFIMGVKLSDKKQRLDEQFASFFDVVLSLLVDNETEAYG